MTAKPASRPRPARAFFLAALILLAAGIVGYSFIVWKNYREAPAGSWFVGKEAFRNGVGMRMRYAPAAAGTGMSSGFWIGAMEVTQAEFFQVLGANPSGSQGPDLPVENVTRPQVLEFCRVLNERERGEQGSGVPRGYSYRLPGEKEWEYACRAGNKPGDEDGKDGDKVAWHLGNSGGQIRSVGTRKPNAWGIYDMLGNVAELCAGRPRVSPVYRVKVILADSDVRRSQPGSLESHASRLVREEIILAALERMRETGGEAPAPAVDVKDVVDGLEVSTVPGTRLLALRFSHTDAEAAARVANAVAETYIRDCQEEEREECESSIIKLQRELDRNEAALREAQIGIGQARAQPAEIPTGGDSGVPVPPAGLETVQNALETQAALLAEMKIELARLRDAVMGRSSLTVVETATPPDQPHRREVAFPVRGGSVRDDAARCVPGERDWLKEGKGRPAIGFRVVLAPARRTE